MMAATVRDALAATEARLRSAGIAEPRADAEVLLAHVLGTTRAGLVIAAREELPATAGVRLDALVDRRAAREPVHHLVGEREFWSLPLAVDRRALVPRPETELVVEAVLRLAPDARRVVDVGTGSGAIAAALARELSGAHVWATEVDDGACAVARENLRRHAPTVTLVRADLLAAFRPGAFDVVVSNPPYVSDAELATLAPEVREHEPRGALAGGADGLDVLRALVAEATGVLVPGGWLVVEMGAGQADAVRALVAGTGRYGDAVVARDHAGIERVLAAAVTGGEGGWIRS